ncbi:MAG: hypothetical protein AB8B93_15185 [Pseudomonadales bacterium]
MYKLLILVVALLPVTALAGKNQNGNIVVGDGYAYGGLHDARYSGTENEGLICRLEVTRTKEYIRCSAKNRKDVVANCQLLEPPLGMVIAVAAINESSQVAFVVNDKGRCRSIDVANNSSNL